jgi:hypothetical protein
MAIRTVNLKKRIQCISDLFVEIHVCNSLQCSTNFIWFYDEKNCFYDIDRCIANKFCFTSKQLTAGGIALITLPEYAPNNVQVFLIKCKYLLLHNKMSVLLL